MRRRAPCQGQIDMCVRRPMRTLAQPCATFTTLKNNNNVVLPREVETFCAYNMMPLPRVGMSAMKPGKQIPDIKQRLRLFELYFEFDKNEKWLDLLGYEDVASVSRVKNGHTGINEAAIKRICVAAGIKRKDFDIPLWELANLLEVTEESGIEEIIESIDKAIPDVPSDMLPSDIEVMKLLPGSYILLYPGREELHIDRNQIVVEKIDINSTPKMDVLSVSQHSNFVTGEHAAGSMWCRSGRVMFDLKYHKTFYPNSTFLLQPVMLTAQLKILSGIYMDVALPPQLQIFATQCCMFSVEKPEDFPRRYSMEHDLFAHWYELMDNKTNMKGRLIAKAGDEFYEKLRVAVLKTIKEGGR